MIIKLVRTDSITQKKILLSQGEHEIGRGEFLNCDDKHISRQHGKVRVSNDFIVIEALHQNPCFYKKKGTTQAQILQLGNTITLYNGEKFGLLPDTFWYEILVCQDDSDNNESDNNTEEYSAEQNMSDQNITLNSIQVNINVDDNSNISVKRELPSPMSTDNIDHVKQPEAGVSNPVKTEPVEQKYNNPSTSSIKRSLSPDVNDVKKIKTGDSNVESKPDGLDPGPSDQAGAANILPVNNDTNNKPRPRERCMYGGNCYRRNPLHKSQFSHPHDPDWGPGERGVCPYGAGCARADPRHWQRHDHPPGARPPPPPGQKRKKPDVLQVQNVITGKRLRRKVERQGWSDSESEPDPYGTDESEEWEPGSQDFSEDYF